VGRVRAGPRGIGVRPLWKRAPVVLALLALAACVPQPVREGDKALLVTIRDLEPYGLDLRRHAEAESFDKDLYLDGSLDLEYEFESPEGADENVYIMSTATFDMSRRDALISYRAMRAGLGIGLRFSELEVEMDPGFFSWGNESYFGHLEHEGRVGGAVFSTRLGNRCYAVILAGVYFSDPEEWSAFITPKLEEFRRYKHWGRPASCTGAHPHGDPHVQQEQ